MGGARRFDEPGASAQKRFAADGLDNCIPNSSRRATKQEVKDKLSELHDELKAGIWTPATYTVKQCVMDWLDSLDSIRTPWPRYRGQAEKWIYPKIGAMKLAEFKATDADRFFRDAAKVLGKSSLVKIKSTLVRSIRRAQKYDLIGRNVADWSTCRRVSPGTRREP